MAMEEHKPLAAMAMWAKAMFSGGVSPMVFVVYRQAIATLVLVAITIFANRKGRLKEMVCIGTTGFALVFVAALVGATMNEYLYYQGMHLGSSSMATAMTNLIPASTLVMATSARKRGAEKTAKLGQDNLVMAFLKGPKLLHDSPVGGQWVMGALLLVGSTCCWSLWLILQVPICKWYDVDPLTLAAWMCLLSTGQSALLTSLTMPDLDAWKIHSLSDLMGCIFAGAFGSGVTFYLQSWSITVRGPLYSAMFNPLSTVITTVLAAIILHEQPHVGSLVGAIAVVAGLYIVLWGKAGDGSQSQRVDLEKTLPDSQLDAAGATKPLLADGNPTLNVVHPE